MKHATLALGLLLVCTAGAAHASQACTITLDSNDRMQFDTNTATVSAGCATITVNLTHSGAMPVTAMGHNVVITTTAHMPAVAQAGLRAGAAAQYVPQDDARVIAATRLVGGGQRTSITFPGSRLTAGGAYSFFCSFPGHSAMMRGTLQVTP